MKRKNLEDKMTISETIGQLNSLIDNSKSFMELDDDIWASDIVAINIAKVALQEKEEREKGCDFCCDQEYPDKIFYPKDGYLFYAGYSKQTAPDDFHEEEIENIKFCPMCSRKLVGK